MACEVLAICISDRAPSCIRAPPEAVTSSSGRPCRRLVCAAAVMCAPTPQPRLPPRKRKSIAATTSGRSSMLPCTHSTASARSVSALAWCSRSLYGLVSVNSNGSCGGRTSSSGAAEPGSSSRSSRCRAVSRPWHPHSGHTRRARAKRLP